MLSQLKQTHLQPVGYHDVTGYSQIKRSERELPSIHFSLSRLPSNRVISFSKPPPHLYSISLSLSLSLSLSRTRTSALDSVS